MEIFSGPVSFEWDEGNFDKNSIKHGVTNQESEEIFFSEQSFIFESEKSSLSEKRYLVWGATKTGRRLAIIFTIRGDKIRIVSARDMNKKERRAYEKKTKINTGV